MFERVLVAIDDSVHGAAMVRAAMALTHPRRTEAWVVHVQRVPVGHGSRTAIAPAEPHAVALVEDAARILRQSGYRARGLVRELAQSGIADELIRLVDEFGPDLLVMGSRGLSDLAALRSASVSYRVLGQAGSPVLVARQGARIEPPRRLLLAYDDSHPSHRAARVAGEVAKATGAEVEVVTVEQPLVVWPGPGVMAWPGAVTHPTTDAQGRVDEIVAKLREEVVARGFVRGSASGRAAAIVQVADECDSDLIVMGTRGLSRIAGAVIGSVSHEVIHLTSRQVLLVP
jgi:nucleotide-binding universal stress UspA family protein